MQDDDNRLEITRTRCKSIISLALFLFSTLHISYSILSMTVGSLLKRHGDLTERLAR